MTGTLQVSWIDMKTALGKPGARVEIARQLRMFARIIESGGTPEILGIDLTVPIGGEGFKGCNFTESLTVTLTEIRRYEHTEMAESSLQSGKRKRLV